MLVLDSTDLIIEYYVEDFDREAIYAVFHQIGQDKILDLGNNSFLTYNQLENHQQPADIRVLYEPNKFFNARQLVRECGYAIVVDAEGNSKAVIKECMTTYIHRYVYEGGLDLTFLNGYDCIFLYGCNEYSVELCQVALKFWEGHNLVLMGKEWEELIPSLPDIPGVDCVYAPDTDEKILLQEAYGMNTLYIVVGIPEDNVTDQFQKGIVYYDEVMILTFMFSDYVELGGENPDKHFFVVNLYHHRKLGLFAFFDKVNRYIKYIKHKKMIPVVSITGCNLIMYSDYDGDDLWEKFFNQPEGYSMEDIKNSKNVYFSPIMHLPAVMSHIMDSSIDEDDEASWPNGIYNDRVMSYIEEKQKEFLPFPDKTLGVLARGTDYANMHLANHAVHASLDMMFAKIDEVLEKREELEYIYLATEDEGYCNSFKERYKEQLYCTDQRRYTTKTNEYLSDSYAASEAPKDGFTRGVEYVLSVNLLSKCRALIASGECSGLGEAIKENQGRWEERDMFVFALGSNPK